MSEPEIKIEFNQAQLQTMVQQWVLKQMDDGQREEIISQALAYLLTPKAPYTGAKATTPLQTAFNNAIDTAMNVAARQVIAESPEIQTKLKEMIGEALSQWVRNEPWGWKQETFVRSMANAVADAFTKD